MKPKNIILISIGSLLFLYSCRKDVPVQHTVTDVDGNVYNTIVLGNQVWMAENLCVTHYTNLDPIEKCSAHQSWTGMLSGAYCGYENDSANVKAYGYLYNGYAVTDKRSICPVGWHIPDDKDWNTLIQFLGGNSDAGMIIRKKNFAEWYDQKDPLVRECNFDALPGGYRDLDGPFLGIGQAAYFWTSILTHNGELKYFYTTYDNNGFFSSADDPKNGFNIRCIKD